MPNAASHKDVETVAIVGLGLIGGSIAKALKQTDAPPRLLGYDLEETLRAAARDGAIDEAIGSIEDAAEADAIFLCLPADASLEAMRTLAPIMRKGSVLTDVCGVKSRPENVWATVGDPDAYVGGHPMTGKERGGYDNSDPLLFENAVYILSSRAKNSPRAPVVVSLVERLGARVKFLDPDFHDRVVANLSHMPQLLSVALMNGVAANDEDGAMLDFAGGGFRDMTRIASSDFDVWEPIVRLNKSEILRAFGILRDELDEVERMIVEDRFEALSDRFESARRKRDEIPKNAKGFLKPLHDIYVFVKDRPGVLHKITHVLAERGVNIKDIELLKFREGAGGTFRLSFDDKRDADIAAELIRDAGFATK
ncbi:MAG: prephenate dehydrogenase/arogenate dehydrogenase family protein [Ignavibacteriales bacterium]|nr:prephenate dehydrogenase/arogenate dehydrogenase family protein [Ignavibacteriales bacterium]